MTILPSPVKIDPAELKNGKHPADADSAGTEE
jgi:hypothetical protein